MSLTQEELTDRLARAEKVIGEAKKLIKNLFEWADMDMNCGEDDGYNQALSEWEVK